MALTKAQELMILDAAIQNLGVDSYLGPYLKDVRADVERDIRGDIMPMALMPSESLKRAARERAGIIEAANAEAARIVERAEAAAKRTAIVVETERRRVVREMQRAIETLQFSLLPESEVHH